MALSCLSVIGTNIPNKEKQIEINPTDVDFLLNVGPFTTVTTGTAGTYKSSVSKTITGKSILNGTYTIRCNYWPIEGKLGDAFDNNTGTFASNVWATFNNVIDYNGNQRSYIGAPYNTTTGVYLFGSTFFTSSDTGNYVGDYIDVYYPMKVIMKKHLLLNRFNQVNRYPKQLYFFGSNDDGTTWIHLHSHLIASNTNGVYEVITFPTTTNSYKVYRMVINSVNSAGSGFWNIAELNMIFDVV